MGNYSKLHFNNQSIFYIRDNIDYSTLALFSINEYEEREYILDGESQIKHNLVTSAKSARTRLELLGYNQSSSKQYFNNMLSYNLQNYNESDDDHMENIEFYEKLTYDKFEIALSVVGKIPDDFFENVLDNDDCDLLTSLQNTYCKHDKITNKFIEEIYMNDYYTTLFNYLYCFGYDKLNFDSNHFLYIFLLCLDDEAIIEYDLTEVFDDEGYDKQNIQEYYNNFDNKTIIITEGKTDIKVLAKSLVLLFPEYAHFFSFFDFYSSNSEGSASYLVKMLKSFIGASIKNRIIAVFDNDTAALEVTETLEHINIPNNIRIMHLPSLEFCKNYPSIGPTGIEKMDINGLAVSIEMFFGKDIIHDNGEYIPIQWKGYSEKLSQYQGSIIHKSNLIKRMNRKLNGELNEQLDWEPLRILWQIIFKQFI